jgi:hypothetical protein
MLLGLVLAAMWTSLSLLDVDAWLKWALFLGLSAGTTAGILNNGRVQNAALGLKRRIEDKWR